MSNSFAKIIGDLESGLDSSRGHTESPLTTHRVNTIFGECLSRNDDPAEQQIVTEGIMATYGLHPERIATHRSDIRAMLAELPDEFHADRGGGWSFLNACMDRRGDHWTGLHATVEKLVVLGMAAGMVAWMIPRELWPALPGGMPYFVVVTADAKGEAHA